MKNDIVHSTIKGAVVGICAFVLVLVIAHFAGWTKTAAGWMHPLFSSLS